MNRDMKTKKEKRKHKKSSKEKKSKRSEHRDSSPSIDDDNASIRSNSDDEWFEAPPVSVASESVSTLTNRATEGNIISAESAVRDSWMQGSLGDVQEKTDPLALFGLRVVPKDATKKETDADCERKRKDAIRRERELNKDFFASDFGAPARGGESSSNHSNPPKKKEVVFGDSKSSWRMMRLKRLQEAAEEDGRDIEELAIERWGSIKELEQLIHERDHLDRKVGKSSMSKHSRHFAAASTEKYKSSADFKRPKVSDDTQSEDREEKSQTNKSSPMSRIHSRLAGNLIPTAATGGIVVDSIAHERLNEPILSLADLNKMNSRILRNSMMGTEDAELVAKYEREKQRYENSDTGSGNSNKNKTVIVPTINSRGQLQDIGSDVASSKLSFGNAKRKREDLKATYDEKGQRINYPGESETSASIADLLLQEKMSSAANYDAEMANRITKDTTYREDLDYMDEKAEDLAKKTQVSDYAKRQNAIHDYKKANSALEKCLHCFQESTGTPKVTVLATATRIYLALPATTEMVPFHCQIVPIDHTLTSLELDDDDWTEIRNFMKCLIQMNWERGHGCVFMEQVVNFKWHKHTVLECIPIPLGKFEDAPAYFKEAINASEEEWSQHKKVIDTSKNGFRRSLVKNMPYFHVWFEPNKGIGHVIEDSQEWPEWFGREVLASMMDLPPDKWRKPKRATSDDCQRRKASFRAAFDKFDWTKVLE
ncbi:hypothetical protein HK100_003441 [Physocladia obscura]|uniref:CWF19-like protein 2 n=1 Tax=Physocladia obscura TaxID=109957 RepID=A0AAD5XL70_9FUNG|nr:hypothetical protein HK100_003441 [Physocladia obscura]